VKHDRGAGLVDGGGTRRPAAFEPPAFDELGEFSLDIDIDEAGEVDVLAVARAMNESSSPGTSRPGRAARRS
jgi:hypothetical protein